MNLKGILNGYRPYDGIIKNIDKTPISVSGVVESAQPQLISAISSYRNKNTLVVTYSEMEAMKIVSDLRVYADNVTVFPSKEYVFFDIESMGRSSDNARLSVLDKIISGENNIIVASVDALMTYTADRQKFENGVISFSLSEVYNIKDITEKLVDIGYKREDMIEGPGQFSLRGGILDIYSPNNENPVRIEFWDDEIDSIRTFDVDSQRAIENIESVRVIPVSEALYSQKRKDEIVLELTRRLKNSENEATADYVKSLKSDIEMFNESVRFPSVDKYVSLIYGFIPSLLDYFTEDDTVFVADPKRIGEKIKAFEWEKNEMLVDLKSKGIIPNTKASYYKTSAEIINTLSDMKMIALEILSHTKNDFNYKYLETFHSKSSVSFHGKLEYLFEDLKKWQDEKYTVVILTATKERAENLNGVFNERGIKTRISSDSCFDEGEIVVIYGNSAGGFEYPEIKFVLVSEHEIFRSEHSRRKRKADSANLIKSYTDINPGDYVVHVAHGIGEYLGMQKMTVNGISKDYLKIAYRGSDVLYVPVDQLNMLHKYSGKNDEKTIKLNKLGTQEWSRAKARVKEATDELAKQLIKLYAEREQIKGYAFSEDTPWQRQFEDTFKFSETTDQLRSIEEVKVDMEKPVPMDRLLCGDVGFGKTEVALRAAFKAVCDSKQVAYLCPTTILAMQHYETFVSRMADFPITVDMLSRFKTPKQQKETIKKLKDGRVDIIIGTHRMLSKDVTFKDLGLLIIDEEQRFGVAHKERLKELKSNIDVLTMTATPIPRTLHMAMTSVRDMSVLANPPRNRYPVQTYVLEFNETIIIDAISRELVRGGQVFYLYNRVQGIFYKAEWLKKHFPDINIAVAHGKMSENELEDIMYDMVNGTTQILVCTTIIETGLDIPNANTMIIENSDKMGLAQLYQLRGRVGRSNRSAYAYLTYKKDKILTSVSQKRLSAIREFTEFGSGFKIAMRDLEIRGAGNILGGQQHGHMDNVGYDMYCKILKESIDKISGKEDTADKEVAIDISVNAYIPESYISSPNQRIDMYKKIAAIESREDETEIHDELIDRYGEMPKAVVNIINVALIKIPAREVGCVEITEKMRVLTLKFSEGRLTPGIVFGLDNEFRGRVKVLSDQTPSIQIRMLEKDKGVLEFVNKILILIKELQN